MDKIKKEAKLIFEFEEKTHENSEGQHIVFYLENELVGGGEIKKIILNWINMRNTKTICN